MSVAFQVLTLAHLIGFAGLLGGVLAQTRQPEPEVTMTMVWGAVVELLSGIGLWVVAVGPDAVPVAANIVSTVILAFVTLLVVLNRRYASIPRGLWLLIGLLSVVEAAIGVFWS